LGMRRGLNLARYLLQGQGKKGIYAERERGKCQKKAWRKGEERHKGGLNSQRVGGCWRKVERGMKKKKQRGDHQEKPKKEKSQKRPLVYKSIATIPLHAPGRKKLTGKGGGKIQGVLVEEIRRGGKRGYQLKVQGGDHACVNSLQK